MLSENTKAKLEAYYKLKLNRIPFNPAMLQVTKRALLQAGIPEEEIDLLEEYAKVPRDEQTAFVKRMKSRPIPFDIFLNGKYALFQQEIEKLEQEGKLKQWLVKYINNYLKPKEKITVEDVESLKLVTESIPLSELREDYGNAYIRPFFLLDMKDYMQFYKKFTGHAGSAGCSISGGGVDKNTLTKDLIILISSGLKEYVYHELRHSIDTYLHKRKREDKVIEEFIGFFGDIVRPRVYTLNIQRSGPGTPTTTTEVKKHTAKTSTGHIGSALKQEIYHSQICPDISFDEYKAVVDNVAKILERLQQYFSIQEIDRILYHCKTIDDLKRVYLVVSIQGRV